MLGRELIEMSLDLVLAITGAQSSPWSQPGGKVAPEEQGWDLSGRPGHAALRCWQRLGHKPCGWRGWDGTCWSPGTCLKSLCHSRGLHRCIWVVTCWGPRGRLL